MIGGTLRLTRAVRHRSHPVEKQKRIDVVETLRGKRARDDHPLSFELGPGLDDLVDSACGRHSLVTTKGHSLTAGFPGCVGRRGSNSPSPVTTSQPPVCPVAAEVHMTVQTVLIVDDDHNFGAA